MKIRSIFSAFLLFGTIAMTAVSCDDDDSNGGSSSAIGTISGTVWDSQGAVVEGVLVSVTDREETALTSANGTYSLSVPVETIIVTFSKDGYQTASVTVPGTRFDSDNCATVNATLTVANAVITGVVYDGVNGNVPISGATVTLGTSRSVTTGSDGVYTFSSLTLADYTLTASATDFVSATASVTSDMFVEENDVYTATVDITLYTSQPLPGMTVSDLQKADKWYYNEYKGGNNGQEYPRWDWSTCFMAALQFYGTWDEIGEGTDLRYEEDNTDPVDTDNFVSYMVGSKSITDDNYYMTVRFRTFADRDGATEWGVSVVDLSEAEPAAVKIGSNVSSDNTDYEDVGFDLSDYIGKEIIIAIGVYKSEEGVQKHLAMRRICFTPQYAVSGWDWITGTDVEGLPGWHMTAEKIRSTMPSDYTSFSGLTTATDTGDRKVAKQSWRENNHVGWLWSFDVVSKDTEPFAGQGFVFKTNSGSSINYDTPESFFYSKFNISSSNDQITFRMRNFSSNATFFKVTAITEDCEVTHLSPSSYTVYEEEGSNYAEAVADANGCWKFVNNYGESGNPELYATFTYDLSAYTGENVIVAIGVYKGENNTDESKICLYGIEMN